MTSNELMYNKSSDIYNGIIPNKSNEIYNGFIYDKSNEIYSGLATNISSINNGSLNISNQIPNQNISVSFLSQTNYIWVYTSFILASIILTLLRSFIFFKICMNASKTLHNSMFWNVLQATMRFFDTNPSG